MSAPRPTESELSILGILWEHGPLRVREVTEHLSRDKGEEVGYTTALKLLQIMHEKGLVTRDESQRSHVYKPAHAQRKIQKQVIRSVADRIFGGATAELAMQAFSARKAKPGEIQQMRELLDKLERKQEK